MFCSTCLKNQHILAETLANYLPPPEDPQYSKFESSYPVFRRELEKRYPPICPRCEPAASQQIKQARDTAKSDHLRRMMERSRQSVLSNPRGWRRILVDVGGLFFWCSLLGQLIWHLTNILINHDDNLQTTGKWIENRLAPCSHRIFVLGKPGSGLVDFIAPIMRWTLVFGVMSVWWNPMWKYKLQGRVGQLHGLREYYLISVAILLARLAFWTWASHKHLIELRYEDKIAHTLASMLLLIFSMYALTRVKATESVKVSWQRSSATLLTDDQSEKSQGQPLHAPQQAQKQAESKTRFPIGALAPEATEEIWQAPIPSSNNDVDMMEWEPSHAFRTKQELPSLGSPPRKGHSPFHDALPPKPTNYLLHAQHWTPARPKEALGVPPGMFDKRERMKRDSKVVTASAMSQPKLFLEKDHEANTGLEGIFDSVFSLHDQPVLPRENVPGLTSEMGEQGAKAHQIPISRRRNTEPLRLSHAPGLEYISVARLAFFGLASIICYLATKAPTFKNELQVCVLFLVAALSFMYLFLDVRNMAGILDSVKLLPSGFLLLGSVLLAIRKQRERDLGGDMDQDHSVPLFLCLCCFWELPRLVAYSSRPICLSRSSDSESVPLAPPLHEHEKTYDMAENQWLSEEINSGIGRTYRVPAESIALDIQTPVGSTINDHHSYEDNFQDLRQDSSDSLSSQTSMETSTTTTSAGWKTPSFRPSPMQKASGNTQTVNLRNLGLKGNDMASGRAVPNRVELRNRMNR